MMTPVVYTLHPSPIGELLLIAEGDALTGLYMLGDEGPNGRGARLEPDWKRDDGPFRAVRDQLDEYFAGERTGFDVPLAPRGTAFQLRVWEELRRIPYGETISYGELARRIGRPTAVRAVGASNGRNPISILVPCHRVIGADGSLTGYGGGLDRKRFLLELEAGVLARASAG